jgi:hypothetical protein
MIKQAGDESLLLTDGIDVCLKGNCSWKLTLICIMTDCFWSVRNLLFIFCDSEKSQDMKHKVYHVSKII